jgi:hypothetical protein
MCRSRSGRRSGCHNDRPAVGSRSVLGDYEASFSVFEAFFLGFNVCLFGYWYRRLVLLPVAYKNPGLNHISDLLVGVIVFLSLF